MKPKDYKLGKKCVYCGCKEPLYLTVDHIVPKCKGGKDKEKNYQTTCLLCNKMKNGFDEEKFLKMRKSLRKLKEDKVITVNGNYSLTFNAY